MSLNCRHFVATILMLSAPHASVFAANFSCSDALNAAGLSATGVYTSLANAEAFTANYSVAQTLRSELNRLEIGTVVVNKIDFSIVDSAGKILTSMYSTLADKPTAPFQNSRFVSWLSAAELATVDLQSGEIKKMFMGSTAGITIMSASADGKRVLLRNNHPTFESLLLVDYTTKKNFDLGHTIRKVNGNSANKIIDPLSESVTKSARVVAVDSTLKLAAILKAANLKIGGSIVLFEIGKESAFLTIPGRFDRFAFDSTADLLIAMPAGQNVIEIYKTSSGEMVSVNGITRFGTGQEIASAKIEKRGSKNVLVIKYEGDQESQNSEYLLN